MAQLWDNPVGTDGFEFVEYTAPDVAQLHAFFEQMGFRAVGRHRSKAVTLYRQGDVSFVVNAEPGSHGARFAREHGPSACAMAFRVKDAPAAYKNLIARGARPFQNQVGPMELNIPAIEGIGGSVIYLVDRYGERSIYDVDFVPTDLAAGFEHQGAGLTYIDHVTHNVFRGNLDKWAGFYERLFNFREIRYFDIEGKLTGLMKVRGVAFQDTPETYYERLDNRIKGHGEDVDRLKRDRILMDGAPTEGQGLLLQIFTQNAIGPIFFEIIQRKGNEGFGEGNFRALFESIELDQIRRGVLQDTRATS